MLVVSRHALLILILTDVVLLARKAFVLLLNDLSLNLSNLLFREVPQSKLFLIRE